jgi:hypothetical protein
MSQNLEEHNMQGSLLFQHVTQSREVLEVSSHRGNSFHTEENTRLGSTEVAACTQRAQDGEILEESVHRGHSVHT